MTEKRRHFRILSCAIVFVVSLFALESSLRVLKYWLLPFVGVHHQPCIFKKDEQIGYRYEPNSTGWLHRNFEMDNNVKINSDGFHDVERSYAQSAKKRKTILAVGDSFTAAIHVPISQGWVQVLEQKLRDFSVVNIGQGGTGTHVHLAILKESLTINHPELVILAFYKNDIQDIQRKTRFVHCYKGNVLYFQNQEQEERLKRYVDENEPSKVTQGLFDRYFTFRVASKYLLPSGRLLRDNRVAPYSIGLDVGEESESPEDINKLLTEFMQLSKQENFDFLIIPVPTKKSLTGSLDVFKKSVSPKLLEQLEVVDISVPMKQLLENHGEDYSNLFWKYDGHFNSKGYELFGTAVARILGQRSK